MPRQHLKQAQRYSCPIPVQCLHKQVGQAFAAWPELPVRWMRQSGFPVCIMQTDGEVMLVRWLTSRSQGIDIVVKAP